MVKIALVLFTGPEMPCKMQHTFLLARDVVAQGGEAQIILEGNSLRWLVDLVDPEHRMTKLFRAVCAEGLFAGACRGCAVVHGAAQAAEDFGLPLLSDAFGHASLVPFIEQGYQIVTL